MVTIERRGRNPDTDGTGRNKCEKFAVLFLTNFSFTTDVDGTSSRPHTEPRRTMS